MYPDHLRPKAEVFYNFCNYSVRHVAQVLGVSKSTAGRWILTKGIKPRRKERNQTHGVTKLRVLECCKDLTFETCEEIRILLKVEHSIDVSVSTVHRARKSLGLTFKRAARSYQHELPAASHPFMHDEDPYRNAICVDESCFVSSDTPRYGWAIAGQTVPKPAPRKRNTISTILAIDRNGIVAKQSIKGNYNSKLYAAFIASLPRGRTIIADNVSFHKSWRVKLVAYQRNQTLAYTPPYCPWMNPVEHGFSVAKHAFRKRRFDRPSESFRAAVDASFATVSSASCEGFYRGADATRRDAIARLRAAGSLSGIQAQRGRRSYFLMDF